MFYFLCLFFGCLVMCWCIPVSPPDREDWTTSSTAVPELARTEIPERSNERKDSLVNRRLIVGSWMEWAGWGECEASCEKRMYRECDGERCRGSGERIEPCRGKLCPGWTEWNHWSYCSVSCGPATESRIRKCVGDELCQGAGTENRQCTDRSVPITCKIDGDWTPWQLWSQWTTTGTRERVRNCDGINCVGTGLEIEEKRNSSRIVLHLDEVARSRAERQHNILNYDYTDFLNLTEINTWLDNKIEQCGKICHRINFGLSYEGRIMWGIKISRWRTGGNAIFIDGGMHGREWASPITVLYIIDMLTSNYNKDKNVTKLINHFDFYILPVFNVDGYEYSWKDAASRLWRKTRSHNSGSPKCMGADPNRNFDYKWNTVGVVPEPCNNLYPGPYPVSEVECRNVAEYLLNLGDGYLDAYFSYHSYGQAITYPYGHTIDNIALHKEHLSIAERGAQALYNKHGETYRVGPTSTTLYYTSGTSQDWVYGSLKVTYSFLFELRDKGTYRFLMPSPEVKPTAEEAWEATKVMCIEIMNRD